MEKWKLLISPHLRITPEIDDHHFKSPTGGIRKENYK